jgi:hypothetical protein
MKSVQNQVYRQVRDKAYGQVLDQVYYKVYEQALDEVYYKVYDQVRVKSGFMGIFQIDIKT